VDVIGSGLEVYLHRQATKMALDRVAEAREQAAAIRQQAQHDLLARKKLTEQERTRENREERRRTLALATLEAARYKNQIYEQMLESVWQQVEAELRQVALLPVQQRADILKRLLIDAVVQLQGGVLEAAVATHDMALVTPALLQSVLEEAGIPDARLSLRQQAADIWGGALVFHSTTSAMVDNSFAARLALVKESQREQVFMMLSSAA